MHPKTKQKDSLDNTDNSIIRMYGSGYIRVPTVTQKSHTDTNKQFSSPKTKKT